MGPITLGYVAVCVLVSVPQLKLKIQPRLGERVVCTAIFLNLHVYRHTYKCSVPATPAVALRLQSRLQTNNKVCHVMKITIT